MSFPRPALAAFIFASLIAVLVCKGEENHEKEGEIGKIGLF